MAVVEDAERTQYLERQVTKTRRDKVFRVNTLKYKDYKAVELRDWLQRPDEEGWRPSSGVFLPLSEVIALRKALQRIEEDEGLVEEEEEEEGA